MNINWSISLYLAFFLAHILILCAYIGGESGTASYSYIVLPKWNKEGLNRTKM